MYGEPVAGKPKAKGQPVPPVRWRDGVHLTGTAIWCDAKRSRDICFVSTASALPHARHGQLVGTAQTLQLLDRPGHRAASQLAVPLAQPFTLGTQRIEIFASGHAYGSASLLVRCGQTRVIFAGAVQPLQCGLGGAMDQRSADVLVLSAPYGQKRFSFADPGEVSERLVVRCREICDEGSVAVVLVDGIGKAMDVAEIFKDSGLVIAAQHSLHQLCAVAHIHNPSLPSPKRWNPKGKEGRVLLWPLSKCGKLKLSELPAKSRVLLVSGRALEKESVAASGASEGFAWSNQADYAALLQYIRDSGAARVYLTHSADRGSDLAGALPGVSVEAIGPPEQLTLF